MWPGQTTMAHIGYLKVTEIQVSEQNEGTVTLCKIQNHSPHHIP